MYYLCYCILKDLIQKKKKKKNWENSITAQPCAAFLLNRLTFQISFSNSHRGFNNTGHSVLAQVEILENFLVYMAQEEISKFSWDNISFRQKPQKLVIGCRIFRISSTVYICIRVRHFGSRLFGLNRLSGKIMAQVKMIFEFVGVKKLKPPCI